MHRGELGGQPHQPGRQGLDPHGLADRIHEQAHRLARPQAPHELRRTPVWLVQAVDQRRAHRHRPRVGSQHRRLARRLGFSVVVDGADRGAIGVRPGAAAQDGVIEDRAIEDRVRADVDQPDAHGRSPLSQGGRSGPVAGVEAGFWPAWVGRRRVDDGVGSQGGHRRRQRWRLSQIDPGSPPEINQLVASGPHRQPQPLTQVPAQPRHPDPTEGTGVSDGVSEGVGQPAQALTSSSVSVPLANR